MRSMYRAAPGFKLVHADFSQLELRVMSAVSGDSVLKAALTTGDVYSEDARDIFGFGIGVNVKKMHPQERDASKKVHLAFQYGAGIRAIFGSVLESMRDAKFSAIQLIHERMKKRYYQTVEYWEDEYERVKADGYSESRILHRRRVYPRLPPITETSNYPIQATASDIANLSMISLDEALQELGAKRGYDWDVLNGMSQAGFEFQLHDAFDVECQNDLVPDVERIMKVCMEQPFEIGGRPYTFPVEIKTGTYWNEVQ